VAEAFLTQSHHHIVYFLSFILSLFIIYLFILYLVRLGSLVSVVGLAFRFIAKQACHLPLVSTLILGFDLVHLSWIQVYRLASSLVFKEKPSVFIYFIYCDKIFGCQKGWLQITLQTLRVGSDT